MLVFDWEERKVLHSRITDRTVYGENQLYFFRNAVVYPECRFNICNEVDAECGDSKCDVYIPEYFLRDVTVSDFRDKDTEVA